MRPGGVDPCAAAMPRRTPARNLRVRLRAGLGPAGGGPKGPRERQLAGRRRGPRPDRVPALSCGVDENTPSRAPSRTRPGDARGAGPVPSPLRCGPVRRWGVARADARAPAGLVRLSAARRTPAVARRVGLSRRLGESRPEQDIDEHPSHQEPVARWLDASQLVDGSGPMKVPLRVGISNAAVSRADPI